MTSEYENLREFLGCYFHQDWTVDAHFSMDVVKFYLSEWPKEEAILAMEEIELLLSTRNDEEIDRAAESMGCYFVPRSEGYSSFSDWFGSVEMLMRQTLATKGEAMNILIPEEQLSISATLMNQLAERDSTVDWVSLDDDLRTAYLRHLAFLDPFIRHEWLPGRLSDPEGFYNAYYWALVFSRKYQERRGYDAGVEQAAFKLLDSAPEGVDWNVVERVNLAAHSETK